MDLPEVLDDDHIVHNVIEVINDDVQQEELLDLSKYVSSNSANTTSLKKNHSSSF